jgi:hypothetical protein
VYGTVRDVETGNRLPGVRVQLVGDDEQVLADTTTDDAGRYILQAPNPGPYRVQVELPGYPSTRTTVQVLERQVVEVRWHLAHNAPQQTSLEVHAFGTSGCDEWSDRERLSGSVGSLLEWRWRLCDSSDEQYEIQIEMHNATDQDVEFSYRAATIPASCNGIDPRTDRLSDVLRGQMRLRPGARGWHRGRRGLINKDPWKDYFYLCIFDWRTVPRTTARR